jgi:S1-C subfamily serine protease
MAILAGHGPLVYAEPAAAVLDAEAQRIAVIRKAKECVLAVFAANGRGGGSGVVITSDGYALTNFHVAQPCGAAAQCGMADGRIYDAAVVGVDPTGDVAMLKLFGRNDFPHAELADSDQVQAGDWVFAMGNPFLLATDLQPTVTYGIVSGVHRYQPPAGTLLEYTDCIQTDVSINPGNSGGPLFDARGRLIGINGRCSFEKRGRVNVGAAYAISINQIKSFLGALYGGRVVDHATLGARAGFDSEGRVVVNEILDSCDAYRRGLRDDDEIISFGGRPISTPNGFKNVLGIFPKGWRVPLSYRREGKRYDILVRLSGLHGKEELWKEMAGRPSSEPMPIPKPDDAPTPDKPDRPRVPGVPDGKPLKVQPHGPQIPGPNRGRPGHGRAEPAEVVLPEIVKKHYQQKHGYANYYFNRLNQERVWKAWTAHEGLAGLDDAWTLAGLLEGGGAFRFELSDRKVTLFVPSSVIPWTAESDFSASLLPPQSGGLLPALYLWKRLATEGLDRFGEVEYDGTAPLAGHTGLVDVLVGSHKGVECRFYFDPTEGDLLALEFFADEGSDPCEVYFSEFRPSHGHILPGRMEVRYGNEPFATFHVREYDFGKGKAQIGN